MQPLNNESESRLFEALNNFKIELPSWGFADTGTRFGKFTQPAAAIDLGDKLQDAGQVNALTGACPTVAMHVLWDLANEDAITSAEGLASQNGVSIGSINPNLFQDQIYKQGSLAAPDPEVRSTACKHVEASIDLAERLGSQAIALWLPDGTNYPGQDSIRKRKQRLESSLKAIHSHLKPSQTLLVEYKPFEPAFYQTDLADWGMAYLHAKKAGPQAKVLVDTGHHYPSQNIEQIVAFLLDEGMLGGFHFNDRRYADDDLTLGSIDPYQLFRIFAEIHLFAQDNGGIFPEIDYMIDQSHNLKPKLEAMIQSVDTAQRLYAKAALIDFEALNKAQASCNIVDAEQVLKTAYETDISGALAEWREGKGLPVDPIKALRESSYIDDITADRVKRRASLGPSTSAYA